MHTTNTRQPGRRGTPRVLLVMLAALFSILAACGFHPRGSSALPSSMAVTYIQSGSPYSSLVADFSTALQAHGGRITRQRSEATAVLHIVSSTFDKRILSVDTAGKVLEYETRETINFSVETDKQLPVVGEQEVSLARNYVFSSSTVLSTQREDKTLRGELQRSLVDLAMLRITAAAQ